VKFGPFFDFGPQVLTYDVTPPLGSTGAQTFTGATSADGSQIAVTGANSILPAPLHPADVQPADRRITIDELTAYAAAWRKGESWSTGPNPIPVDYVTRAGFLWKNGEWYSFDPNITQSPLWWILRPATAPMGLRTSLGSITPVDDSSATRVLPPAVVPGEPFIVEIQAHPAAVVSAYALEEQAASGWAITKISDNGEYDPAHQLVRWGPFFDSVLRDLTYEVSVPAGLPFTLAFSGSASFDGVSETISGAQSVGTSVRLKSLVILPSGELSLSLGEADGQSYLIETSSDLEQWTSLTTVSNVDGTLQFKDPTWGVATQRFYRATRQGP
jgi:hypothetical protein